MLHKKYKTLFEKNQITSKLRLAHFMAQIEHESNLRPVAENFNYSRRRLLVVFPKYFNEFNVDLYAGKPEKVASRVYADRMGNGNELSGDGFKYRGRGFIQLTGLSNYKTLFKDTLIDYVTYPNLLLNEADAMIAALWYWSSRNLNSYADIDDCITITKKINGGTNGLENRKKLVTKWKNYFDQNGV